MSTDHTSTQNGSAPPPATKAELEAEIQELRQSVGETVEALSYRLDVKTRAKEKVQAIPPYVPAGIAAAVAVGLGLWLWRRHG